MFLQTDSLIQTVSKPIKISGRIENSSITLKKKFNYS